MSEITRYVFDVDGDGVLREKDANGYAVLFDDHERVVRERDAENAQLRAELAEEKQKHTQCDCEYHVLLDLVKMRLENERAKSEETQSSLKAARALLVRAKKYLPAPYHNRSAMHDSELGCGRGCDFDALDSLHAELSEVLAVHAARSKEVTR